MVEIMRGRQGDVKPLSPQDHNALKKTTLCPLSGCGELIYRYLVCGYPTTLSNHHDGSAGVKGVVAGGSRQTVDAGAAMLRAGGNAVDAAVAAKVKKFVFSSTCATYGIPEEMPMHENLPQHPVNPYGESKLMFEQMLRWYGQIHGVRSLSLRYFNASGAAEDARIGEDHEPETHLIPLVVFAAQGRRVLLIEVEGRQGIAGLFDTARAIRERIGVGLATDTGGGSSFSMLRTMAAAYEVGQLRGRPLHPAEEHRRGPALRGRRVHATPQGDGLPVRPRRFRHRHVVLRVLSRAAD